MPDSSFARWADVLVDYSTAVKPGDRVVIGGGVAAEPLLRAIYRAVLRRGAHPILVPSFTETQTDLLANASDEQLAYISPLERWPREEAEVTIDVLASTNTRALSAIDPARQAIWNRARTELREIAGHRHEEISKAKPFSEVFPDFHESIKRARGRPAVASPRRQISIRLDPDVIEKFTATGKGWQNRINEVLKQAKV